MNTHKLPSTRKKIQDKEGSVQGRIEKLPPWDHELDVTGILGRRDAGDSSSDL